MLQEILLKSLNKILIKHMLSEMSTINLKKSLVQVLETIMLCAKTGVIKKFYHDGRIQTENTKEF